MKNYSGKSIYNPSGKAGEYSYWACNLYVGCSSDCEYCYCKKILRGIWTNNPVLKKCLVDENKALEIFEREINENLISLQEHGLFFNFVSDPWLPETISLNLKCIGIANKAGIYCKILTKQKINCHSSIILGKENIFGFSLTGHDELEPGASTNIERIKSMENLYLLGYNTFASIEPIIDLESSAKMIQLTHKFCNHYKIGVKSGVRLMNESTLKKFIFDISNYLKEKSKSTIYWKEGTLKHAGLRLEELPSNCVDRNYKYHIRKE